MTIEADLYTFLTATVGAAVGNRIHYFRAPQPAAGQVPPMPFVVYTVTGREMLTTLEGVTNQAATEVQIDVVAADFKTAKAMAKTIRKALAEWSLPDASFHENYDEFLDEAVTPPVPRAVQTWTLHHGDA